MSVELGFPNIIGLTVTGVKAVELRNGQCDDLCIIFNDGSSITIAAPWEEEFKSSFSIEVHHPERKVAE